MQATPTTNYQEAYETLQPKYEAILQELAVLKRMVFGSKSERFIPTDDNKMSYAKQALARMANTNIHK